MVLARSVVAVGVCANATVASKAEPAKPATTDFANMMCLPENEIVGRKQIDATAVPKNESIFGTARIFFSRFHGTLAPCRAQQGTHAVPAKRLSPRRSFLASGKNDRHGVPCVRRLG